MQKGRRTRKGGESVKDYVKRLLEEKNEVSERLQKLKKFLSVEKIPLTEKQRELLEKQASIMSEYESVLHERILLENYLEKERMKKEF